MQEVVMKSPNFVESENLIILILLKFQSFSSKAKKIQFLALKIFKKSHEIPKNATFATTEKLSWQQGSSEIDLSKDTNISLVENDLKNTIMIEDKSLFKTKAKIWDTYRNIKHQ